MAAQVKDAKEKSIATLPEPPKPEFQVDRQTVSNEHGRLIYHVNIAFLQLGQTAHCRARNIYLSYGTCHLIGVRVKYA